MRMSTRGGPTLTGRIPVTVATPEDGGGWDGGTGAAWSIAADGEACLVSRLIARGMNNSEACRIVGINRRTGKRWRHGRPMTAADGSRYHYAPVISTRAEKRISSRYLSEDERVAIAICAAPSWESERSRVSWVVIRRR